MKNKMPKNIMNTIIILEFENDPKLADGFKNLK